MKDRIPAAILPDGYDGKILMVSVGGAGIEDTVILRSGDLWHREILLDTEAEIKGYGIESARIQDAGGAWIRFDEDGSILIYGGSDEFGACDKTHAARLLRDLFPNRVIRTDD